MRVVVVIAMGIHLKLEFPPIKFLQTRKMQRSMHHCRLAIFEESAANKTSERVQSICFLQPTCLTVTDSFLIYVFPI